MRWDREGGERKAGGWGVGGRRRCRSGGGLVWSKLGNARWDK